MNTVLIFTLLIIGVFVQFPVVQGVCRACETPNYCWHGICIHQGRHQAQRPVPSCTESSECSDDEYCIHGRCSQLVRQFAGPPFPPNCSGGFCNP
uniref:Uncharacterized protein n=1 Tax=Caenorhabditis japonica TaxID=281687 RepID=A0A8R1ECA2_CAEJA